MKKPTNKLFNDLTSKQFERLNVIEYAGLKYPNQKSKGHQWLCKCECGNTKIILGASLKSGNTTSCGCVQKENTSKARKIELTGVRYGKLIVISFSHIKNENYFWLCKCECGETKPINAASLRTGRTKSCGCRQGNFTHGMWGKPGYKKLYLSDPVKKLRHLVSCTVREIIKERNGKKTGKTFEHLPYTPQELKIHLEKQFEPWMTWDNYGGRNDSPKKTWQIDHIIPQSNFPYTSLTDSLFLECWALTNLRPLEKLANMRKKDKINM